MSKIIIEIDLAEEDAGVQLQRGIDALGLFLNKPEERIAAPAAAPAAPAAPAAAAPVLPSVPVQGQPGIPVPTSAAPAAPAAVELDSEGLPWDTRIHGDSKLKLVKEGTWKLKRKIDPALVETVKAELKATMAAAPIADASSVFGGKSPSLPETPMQFPEFMQAITERMTSGTMVQESINAALLAHEIPSLPMLASRPDLIPVIAAELGVA